MSSYPKISVRALHPAPRERGWDQRQAPNREQLCHPSELISLWRRAVETLAAELQVDPLEVHFMLQDAAQEITKAVAWRTWP